MSYLGGRVRRAAGAAEGVLPTHSHPLTHTHTHNHTHSHSHPQSHTLTLTLPPTPTPTHDSEHTARFTPALWCSSGVPLVFLWCFPHHIHTSTMAEHAEGNMTTTHTHAHTHTHTHTHHPSGAAAGVLPGSARAARVAAKAPPSGPLLTH